MAFRDHLTTKNRLFYFCSIFLPMAILSREPVTALVAFKMGRAKPVQFLWGNRTYQVKTVDLTYSEWKGRSKIHYFSVHDGTNSFRLSYVSDTLQWFVETEELLL